MKTVRFRSVADDLKSFFVEKKETSGLTQKQLDAALKEVHEWDPKTSVEVEFCESFSQLVVSLLRLQKELRFRNKQLASLENFERYYIMFMPYSESTIPYPKGKLLELQTKLIANKELDHQAIYEGFKDHEKLLAKFISTNKPENEAEFLSSILDMIFGHGVLNEIVFPKLVESEFDMESEEVQKLFKDGYKKIGYKMEDGGLKLADEKLVRELNMQ